MAPLVAGIPVVESGERRVLDASGPVVMLDRVASGIGALRMELFSTHAARLLVLFDLAGKHGVLVGPGPVHGPGRLRPVAGLGAGNSASIDLGQVRSLRRFALAIQAHHYGGALVISTVGARRIEIPLAESPALGTLVVVSGYCVRGAFVLRAELDQVTGGGREAAVAHGYDRIGWIDTNTPLPD